jgi:hypothetical protein
LGKIKTGSQLEKRSTSPALEGIKTVEFNARAKKLRSKLLSRKKLIDGENLMTETEQEIWGFLHRHLRSILTCDLETYKATTSNELSLYEWFVTPHRQDGLDFHMFMVEHNWAGTDAAFRYDLLEPRLQLYENTAIASYTFMLTTSNNGSVQHRTHNESRVLVKTGGAWQVVHVHKSPAGSN